VVAKQFAAANAGQTERPLIASTPVALDSDRRRAESIEHAVSASNLFATQRHVWGSDRFPVITSLILSTASVALLEDLENRPESQAALTETVISICAMSKRFYVGRGILGAIQQAAEKTNMPLPQASRDLIHNFTKATAGREGEKIPTTGLNWLFYKWDDLDLE
jgi:hypothetical protein